MGVTGFLRLEQRRLLLRTAHPSEFSHRVPGNGFEGRLDPETTGIVATLFTFSHLSFRFPSTEVYARRFYQLREFALEHREQQLIFAAID